MNASFRMWRPFGWIIRSGCHGGLWSEGEIFVFSGCYWRFPRDIPGSCWVTIPFESLGWQLQFRRNAAWWLWNFVSRVLLGSPGSSINEHLKFILSPDKLASCSSLASTRYVNCPSIWNPMNSGVDIALQQHHKWSLGEAKWAKSIAFEK